MNDSVELFTPENSPGVMEWVHALANIENPDRG